jgi:hypothetical protein
MAIPIPQRQKTTSGRAYIPRAYGTSDTGSSLMQLGGMLSNVSEDLGELVYAMQGISEEEEYAKALTKYQEDEINTIIEIEQDMDFDTRMDKYKSWSENRSAEIINEIRHPKAKEKFNLWIENYRVGQQARIGIGALSDQASFIRTDAPRKQSIWIQTGNKQANDWYADNVYGKFHSPEAVELFKQSYEIGRTKYAVFHEALNLPLKEGEKLIRSSNLPTDEKQKLMDDYHFEKKIEQGEIEAKERDIILNLHNNRNVSPRERLKLGEVYIEELSKLGLTGPRFESLVGKIEKWMDGRENSNNSLVYVDLHRKVTELHRGIGKAEKIRNEIVDNYSKLDDSHFESLNKYLDETVEGWNAGVLRRLEKEAISQLAPRLSMLERFIEMSAMPGISASEKAKYDNLIERLREPAKQDADRLAMYLDHCRKWIAANPDKSNFYENGRRILTQFEAYTDAQIDQMERQLESGATLEKQIPDQYGFTVGETRTVDDKNYEYIGNNKWKKL